MSRVLTSFSTFKQICSYCDNMPLHKENYEIPYKTITTYKVKKGLLNAQVQFEVDREGKIRKITMPIPKKRAERVRQLLAVNVAS